MTKRLTKSEIKRRAKKFAEHFKEPARTIAEFEKDPVVRLRIGRIIDLLRLGKKKSNP